VIDAKTQVLIEAVNKLSSDACYIASCDWFGGLLMGKAILAAANNERQEAAFAELLEAGFVHGDVERGVYGYRSTYLGREASPICRAALAGPPAA
jgi:hypothetical protein